LLVQEPIIVATDALLFLVVFHLLTILFKNYYNRTHYLFYLLAFLFIMLTAFCGILYHINKTEFFSYQKYGTMIFSGLIGTAVALAGIHDNFRKKQAFYLSFIPLIVLAIYYYYYFGVMKAYSFLSAVMMQLFGVVTADISYWRQRRTIKARFIYAASFCAIAGGSFEALTFKVWIFNEDDFFHLFSTLAVFLFFYAISTKFKNGVQPKE